MIGNRPTCLEAVQGYFYCQSLSVSHDNDFLEDLFLGALPRSPSVPNIMAMFSFHELGFTDGAGLFRLPMVKIH
jgi:hypothetical protein